MKNNNVIVLAGAVLAGVAYAVGRKNGFNECLYRCQKVILEAMVDAEKEKMKEES